MTETKTPKPPTGTTESLAKVVSKALQEKIAGYPDVKKAIGPFLGDKPSDSYDYWVTYKGKKVFDAKTKTIKVVAEPGLETVTIPLQAVEESGKSDINCNAKEGKKMQIYPTDELTTGERAKLRYATKMYEPVFGTGESSRYFVVGKAGNVRVGARITSAVGKGYETYNLSIRVEGPLADLQKIDAAGIGLKQAGPKHMSQHFEADDLNKAVMVVAGMTNVIAIITKKLVVSPAPNLVILVNKETG